MKIRKPGPLGRWVVVYVTTCLALLVAFPLLVTEEVVQYVVDNHIMLFGLTIAAISLLVTTIVDDALDGTTEEDQA
jgi:hypothetical protein